MSLTTILLFAAQFLSLALMLFSFLFFLEGILIKVPFVPVSKKVLKDISKALQIKADSLVYDLGSGDGRVLFALNKEEQRAKYIGLELGLIPFFLSKIKNIFNWNKVEFKRKDFFKEDLSGATHIFMYLLPRTMDKLLVKLEAELKPGTKVVSATFKFSNKTPIESIPL